MVSTLRKAVEISFWQLLIENYINNLRRNSNPKLKQIGKIIIPRERRMDF